MDYTQWARESFSGDRYGLGITGVKIDEVRELYSRCSLNVEEKHLNGHGDVMGGVIFTLADCAFGVASNTPRPNCVSLSANINFVRPAAGPTLYAEAKCVKDGRKISFFEVTVTDSQGKIVATVDINGFRFGEATKEGEDGRDKKEE